MKRITIFLFSLFFLIVVGCVQKNTKIENNSVSEENIHQLLDQWHRDAANYDFISYFQKMTTDAVFVGTDASEVWTKKDFENFSEPYFERKETWDFKPLDRNIYLDRNTNTAWFDEVLDTWMGTCRGSGVVVFEEESWKIQHYVLSVAIPNESIKEVIKVKRERDSLFILSIRE